MEHELTRDDIKALRRARDILFKADSNGHAKIIALLDRDGEDTFTDAEKRIFPEIEEDTGYRNRRRRVFFPAGGRAPKLYSNDSFGHCHLMLTTYDHEWQTIASILKPGDRIYINFHADSAQNNYLKFAVTDTSAGKYIGIHADVLKLVVYRGDQKMVFTVETSICPDNSARMIQPYGSAVHGTVTLTPEKVFPEAFETVSA